MYETSQNYKNLVYVDSTKHLLKIYINNIQVNPNHIFDFKVSHQLFTNDEFELGGTISKSIEFKIYIDSLPEIYDNFYVTTGIGDETIPIGRFILEDIERSEDGKIITIKARDNMIKFEFNYDGSQLNYPCSIIDVLRDICIKAGVELRFYVIFKYE